MFDRAGNRKHLNRPERRVYFRAVKNEPVIARRAFFWTLFYTGCRISEALALTAGRVDLTQKALVFETLKQRRRGQFRSVPIPDSLTKLFRQLVAGMKPSERVWTFSRTTGYRFIKDRMAHACIKGGMACPKGLRHGFAVACVSQKIPLPTLKKWMGHARLETTAIYLDVAGDEERAFAKRLWKTG